MRNTCPSFIKRANQGIAWQSSCSKTSAQGAGVPSLVGEPRSYMPCGMVNTKNSEVNKKDKKILYI